MGKTARELTIRYVLALPNGYLGAPKKGCRQGKLCGKGGGRFRLIFSLRWKERSRARKGVFQGRVERKGRLSFLNNLLLERETGGE